MFRQRDIRAACMALLPLLALAVLPVSASAGVVTIGFRNDTKGPIIVQGMRVVNGRLLQCKRLTIQPGATAWDVILVPGNIVVTIVDAKQPTRSLGQDTIQAGAKSLFYAIEPDEDDADAAGKAKGKAKKNPKVKLTPTTPPTTPMGGTTPPRR